MTVGVVRYLKGTIARSVQHPTSILVSVSKMGEMNTAQLHYVEVMCESILHGSLDLLFFYI